MNIFQRKAGHGEVRAADASKSSRTKRPIPVKAVQNIIPIKEISNGLIVTNDGRYIKILEVLPVNFSLKSYDEQDNIIHQFGNWLRIAPSTIQFKVLTRRADSDNIIENIREAAKDETVESCREMVEDHIQFIRNQIGSEALARRFFLIFEYEPTTNRRKTVKEIAADIKDTCSRVQWYFGQCGNEVLFPNNEDFGQAELLYLFYNRSSYFDEPLSARILRVTKDYMASRGLKYGVDDCPDIPIADYIAPRGVDLSHKDYFVCDGIYSSVFYFARDGYPSCVYGGWTSSLVEAGDGVDVDFILRRQPKSQTRDKVAHSLKLTRTTASMHSDTDSNFEDIEGAIGAAKYIKTHMAAGEDLYYLYTFITVSAPTYDEMIRRRELLFDYFKGCDYGIRLVRYRMEDAFLMTSPFLVRRKELMDFSERNILTMGAASLYPVASCELCDDKGIVFGINKRYSSLVNIDIFNTKQYMNANIVILGRTGAGKTYTASLMALRMRYQGIPVYIISPKKSVEFERVCHKVGGSYIFIGPGSPHCINIMDIRPEVDPIAAYLGETVSTQKSWLSQKVAQLEIFLHIIMPEMTNEEEQLADEAIIKTYAKFGITTNNNSIYIPGTQTVKPMPIIGDLYETIRENTHLSRVANILTRFVTGSAANFNQQTNVNLDNKFIVFDMDSLTGVMKAVGMFVAMDFLWGRIKENRTQRKAVFIDEGWQLIGASSDERAADFVFTIFKTIRSYAGSAVFATQDLNDFFAYQGGKFGKAILSNSKTKIVMGLEHDEAKFVKEILQLTKSEVEKVVNFDRGEAIICAGSSKVPVYLRASHLEHELITTDPEELSRIVAQRQQDQASEVIAPAPVPMPSVEPDWDETTDPESAAVVFEPEAVPKQPQPVPSQQEWVGPEARMVMQAMDQLSDTEPSPDDDPDESDVFIPSTVVPVEDEGDNPFLTGLTRELARQMQEEQAPSEGEEDDEAPETENQEQEGAHGDHHPPADF